MNFIKTSFYTFISFIFFISCEEKPKSISKKQAIVTAIEVNGVIHNVNQYYQKRNKVLTDVVYLISESQEVDTFDVNQLNTLSDLVLSSIDKGKAELDSIPKEGLLEDVTASANIYLNAIKEFDKNIPILVELVELPKEDISAEEIKQIGVIQEDFNKIKQSQLIYTESMDEFYRLHNFSEEDISIVLGVFENI